jgi:outer membrane biosynthesis protein TonB
MFAKYALVSLVGTCLLAGNAVMAAGIAGGPKHQKKDQKKPPAAVTAPYAGSARTDTKKKGEHNKKEEKKQASKHATGKRTIKASFVSAKSKKDVKKNASKKSTKKAPTTLSNSRAGAMTLAAVATPLKPASSRSFSAGGHRRHCRYGLFA